MTSFELNTSLKSIYKYRYFPQHLLIKGKKRDFKLVSVGYKIPEMS